MPVPSESANKLLQMVSPAHPEQTPWKYLLDSADGTGPGTCSTKRLNDLIDQIRRDFPAVSDIQAFRPSGPKGVTLNAGPARPLTAPPAPADGMASFVTGYMDDDRFGVTFFRGSGCRAEACSDREYWYFETDGSCQPRWVGHFHAIDRTGGRYGMCVDVVGKSLWSLPVAPAARSRCDADWSPQNISGTRQAFSADPNGTCGSAGNGFIPIEVAITQGSDLSKAEVTVKGTGIPFLDGRAFTGTVERQSFTAEVKEAASPSCGPRREVKIRIDFEDTTFTGIPGGFGLIDVSDPAEGTCAVEASACRASLHLLRGEWAAVVAP